MAFGMDFGTFQKYYPIFILFSYQQFLHLLNTAQPMYLPPVATSSQNLINKNDAVMKEKYFTPDEDKEMINYLTKITSPQRNSPMLKSYQHSNEFLERKMDHGILKGNSDQLQAIGNIGLHLSDFETKVDPFLTRLL